MIVGETGLSTHRVDHLVRAAQPDISKRPLNEKHLLEFTLYSQLNVSEDDCLSNVLHFTEQQVNSIINKRKTSLTNSMNSKAINSPT